MSIRRRTARPGDLAAPGAGRDRHIVMMTLLIIESYRQKLR
jgi:hypothetical protein